MIDRFETVKPEIKEIAERLANGTASVMVGAGFSYNSNDPDRGIKFPDWKELGILFYEKLYNQKPPENENFLDPVKLASEVEAQFGRPVLDNILLNSIPDSKAEPSEVHKKLLGLPWRDVFTTNYDTLLERAVNHDPVLNYTFIYNQRDIILSKPPRIIKLHGSFQSHRPFIITKEDFRVYPRTFSAFVNTVQQAMLETTTVLIGFSGDDPNFLSWLGWIRDNIGRSNQHTVFLINLGFIPNSQKKMLSELKIQIIDLSLCRAESTLDELIFDFLSELNIEIETSQKTFSEWPFSAFEIECTGEQDVGTESKKEQIVQLIREWQNDRESYPGWVVVPRTKRQKLKRTTEGNVKIIRSLQTNEANMILQDKFTIIYEYLWRIEAAILPLEKWVFNIIEPIIAEVRQSATKLIDNQQEKINDINLHLLRYHRENGEIEKWESVNLQIDHKNLTTSQKQKYYYEKYLKCLSELEHEEIFKLLNDWPAEPTLPHWFAIKYNLFSQIGKFNEAFAGVTLALKEVRRQLSQDSNNIKIRSQAAYILIILIHLNNHNRNKIDLSKITDTKIKDFLKKVSKEEINLAKDVVGNANQKPVFEEQRIEDMWAEIEKDSKKKEHWRWRTYLNENSTDLQNLNRAYTEITDEYNNPREEAERFHLLFKKEPANNNQNLPSFDIGRFSQNYSISKSNEQVFEAYSYFRFFQEAGFLLRIGRVFHSLTSQENALRAVAKYMPNMAISILFQLNDEKFINAVFDRVLVQAINREALLKYATELIDKWEKLEKISNNRNESTGIFGANYNTTIPEILSRLIIKSNFDLKKRVIEKVVSLSESGFKMPLKAISNLLRRTITSLSLTEKAELFPIILKIKCPVSYNSMRRSDFPPPVLSINENLFEKNSIVITHEDFLNSTIDYLLNLVNSNEGHERYWGIMSLSPLYKLKILTEDQKIIFAENLWQEDTDRLPERTNLYNFALLELPHPPLLHLQNSLLNMIIWGFEKQAFEGSYAMSVGGKDGIPITNGNIYLFNDLLGAYSILNKNNPNKSILTIEQIAVIVDSMYAWWSKNKSYLKKEDVPSFGPSIREEFESRFRNINNIMITVVFPELAIHNFKNSTDVSNITEIAEKLCYEMQIESLLVIDFQAAFLWLNQEPDSTLFASIEISLSSRDEERLRNTLNALHVLMKAAIYRDNKALLKKVQFFLSIALLIRRQGAIIDSFSILIELLEKYPKLINLRLLRACYICLDYLSEETDFSSQRHISAYDDALFYRKSAATMAYSIYKYLKVNDRQIPESINKWRLICSSEEEMDEVRNEWLFD